MKVLLIIIILAIIAAFTVPLKTEPYTIMERYQEKETYWDKVEQILNYDMTNAYAETNINFSVGVYAQANVSIKNTDTVPGNYAVAFTINTLNRTLTDNVRLYIEPGQTDTARGVADINTGEDWTWNYTITPGTKIVDVQRERTVWRERPVTRYKKVPLLSFD